ncbi:DUF87 domain-containing protein [Bradyrhizobium sp. 192]|uniref:helicase HerA domain-containing protein n=1 Tax=Bradyrhizobium sp. 192 TaxID=2782660 RepID=UPI0020000588|nr:DUF87 domain-containing protein [Bradyrhizobium sp. 192]UPJ55383.1 DUF87 domain-containing protein [Bradyrhizobium sp. 192]
MSVAARVDPLLKALRDVAPAATPVRPAIATSSPAKPPPSPLRVGDIDLGELDTGGPLGISLGKLIAGRLLIQALSGAGKSWTLRRLIEQTRFHVQQIVVDPEGDFRGLAEQLGLLHLDGARLDAAALATAAARAREHRVSLVLDLSDLTPEDQMKALTAFLTALIAVPREHWHPCLVAIDEAHLFAPFGGFSELPLVRRACIAAMVDLMSRGRKRGLTGILATQRLARLHKSVVSDIQNFMIGLNTLDLDIRRATETIGWDARKGFDRLPVLAPGEFVAVGAAFSRTPAAVKVGPVQTKHAGATPELLVPEAFDPSTAAQRLSLDQLLAESAADQEAIEARAKAPNLRAVRMFLREPAFCDAARVYGALLKLAPNGARVKDLPKHLSRTPDQVTAALSLLDEKGALEFDGDGDARAVRIEKGLLA